MKNIIKYNSEMRKSLIDKIFFVDKIDSSIIIDYGCADGIMLKFLAELFPDSELYGYDNNKEMIAIARTNNSAKNITYTSELSDLRALRAMNTAIVASSVLHEIYSYGKSDQQEYAFWENVEHIGAKYVIIRDMCTSNKINHEPSDLLAVAQIYHKFGPGVVSQWENRWGSLHDKKSLVHFLLKYRYMTMNWDRELQENYLSYDFEQLLFESPKNYKINYVEHYTLPFLKNEIKKDLRIDFNEKTHVKLILERTFDT